MTDDLAGIDATAQAELVQGNEASPVELIRVAAQLEEARPWAHRESTPVRGPAAG